MSNKKKTKPFKSLEKYAMTDEDFEYLKSLTFDEEVGLRKHNKKCYPVMFNPKCKYLRLGYSWYSMHLTPFESKMFHLIHKPWYTKEIHDEVQKVLKQHNIELPSMKVIHDTWRYEA